MASRSSGQTANIDPYHISCRTGHRTITHGGMKFLHSSAKRGLQQYADARSTALQNGSTEFCNYMTNEQTAGVE
jgi:hypothetical protein